jgi:pyridoxal/pyridoxine/pyridoxamine kinase
VIYGVLKVTTSLGGAELALVAAQDELIHPSHTFKPARVR